MSGEDRTGLLDLEAWLSDWPPKEWRGMLRTSLEKETVASLRDFTARGRPLGSDAFITRMESLLGRRVRPRPVGRPVGWWKRTL